MLVHCLNFLLTEIRQALVCTLDAGLYNCKYHLLLFGELFTVYCVLKFITHSLLNRLLLLEIIYNGIRDLPGTCTSLLAKKTHISFIPGLKLILSKLIFFYHISFNFLFEIKFRRSSQLLDVLKNSVEGLVDHFLFKFEKASETQNLPRHLENYFKTTLCEILMVWTSMQVARKLTGYLQNWSQNRLASRSHISLAPTCCVDKASRNVGTPAIRTSFESILLRSVPTISASKEASTSPFCPCPGAN